MMKVLGFPIIYAFIDVLVYMLAMIDPAPDTLYDPIYIYQDWLQNIKFHFVSESLSSIIWQMSSLSPILLQWLEQLDLDICEQFI